ncbi:MAG: hypothetical protein IT204_12030 [Fimbriimonadaceae bacterium]|nr:hypothetical protein [Fimbriimonadaceae bacterium]
MPLPRFERHPANPIVWPGDLPWRMAVTFNPGVIHDEGRFWLYERTAGSLYPFHCVIGLRVSDDGVHFKPVGDQPVWTPQQAGSAVGSVQDPRVVRIDDRYLMTYAYRPFAYNYHPTGRGVPDVTTPPYPDFSGRAEDNQTRSGIAVSTDRRHWEHLCWPTPAELDDRDVILFPERIGGRYALLRRPLQYVGPAYGTLQPGIWITFSDDLQRWDPPTLLIRPEFAWEDGRIGGSTPPLRTAAGWLVLYHGVEYADPATRRVIYRVGALLLDLEDPRVVRCRTPHFVMQPEAYYEQHGLFIPHVVFPTANVVVDGRLYLYYGCCDTAIGLATVSLDELLEHVLAYPVR